MKNPVRELTEQEKQRIRKLVTQKCANYHEDYGCLPLDCDCVMLEKCSAEMPCADISVNVCFPTIRS